MAKMADTEATIWALTDRAQRAEKHLSDLHAAMWAASDRIEKLAENIRSQVGIRPQAPDEVALAYEIAADEVRAALREASPNRWTCGYCGDELPAGPGAGEACSCDDPAAEAQP